MKKNIEKKDLRQFGVILGILLLALNLLRLFKGKPSNVVLVIFGACFLLTGLFLPNSLRQIYRVWLKFAQVIGKYNSAVLLFVLYSLILTPIGIMLRLFGKDLLGLKLKQGDSSYWIKLDYKFDKERMKNQF